MSNNKRIFGEGVQLLDVGFKNYILCDRIIAIQEVTSLPVRRMRDRAVQDNMLVDASAGRRERSIIVMDSGHIVVSSLGSGTLQERLKNVFLQDELARHELVEGEFVS